MAEPDLSGQPYTDGEVAVLLNELRSAAEKRRLYLNPTERYSSMPLELRTRLKQMSGHITRELKQLEDLIAKVEGLAGSTSVALLNFDERVLIARNLLVTLAMAKKHRRRSYPLKGSDLTELNIRVAIAAYRKLGVDMREVDPGFAAEARLGASNTE